MGRVRRISAVAALLALACDKKPTPVAVDASPPVHAVRIDGSAFPDHVIALTWDDGPDAHSLELAKYLASEHVSATFFVVGQWTPASEEPGQGTDVFHTGHRSLPILGEYVALGHRLGNHTEHHRLLVNVPRDVVRSELLDNQKTLTPLQTNHLPLFRAPGGYFDDAAAQAVAGENLIGPVHWDMDGKDWEASLYDKNVDIAQRYLTGIEQTAHGIVLMHDRVGAVGSTYAIDLAKKLIPALKAKGFVFAAPVLRFGPFEKSDVKGNSLEGDLNGDGVPDHCRRVDTEVRCALGARAESVWATNVPPGTLSLADANGDHRADLCLEAHGCALSP